MVAFPSPQPPGQVPIHITSQQHHSVQRVLDCNPQACLLTNQACLLTNIGSATVNLDVSAR